MGKKQSITFRVAREILKVVEIETKRKDGSDTDLHFRVEFIRVLGQSQVVTARVWRKEFYRIRPSFPQIKGRPSIPDSDEVLLVEETSIFGDLSVLRGKTIASVLKKVLDALDKKLNGPKFKSNSSAGSTLRSTVGNH